MKFIDRDNWKRKRHFGFFKGFDIPYFNVCCTIDITRFIAFQKKNAFPFFNTLLYFIMKEANGIEEFRTRIREEKIIVHDVVHPSFTYLTKEGLYGFCPVDYHSDMNVFLKNAQERRDAYRDEVNLDDHGRDDLIYITSLPWISFTSIMHPISIRHIDSIPRISWGKYLEQQGRYSLPFSIQVHHGLMDGYHIGIYTTQLQETLNQLG